MMPGLDSLDDRRLRRLSRILAAASLLLAVGLPLAVIWLWWAEDPVLLLSRLAGVESGARPGGWQVLGATVVNLIPTLVLSAALVAAGRCFRCFAEGSYLSHPAASALRHFGQRVAIAAGLGLILPTALGLLLTLDAAPGERLLILSVGSTPLLGLLFGGMVWAIGAVMARAAVLADEHAQIV